jgi:hypothetical protein
VTGLPNWTGETVAILACGPSAPSIARHIEGRCRIIAVNLAHRLVPSADVLYAADSGFWRYYRDAHGFAGLKLAPEDQRVRLICNSVHDIIVLKDRSGRRVDAMQRDPVGVVGCGGGNSAFQAVNLAAQFGASKILLCGIDYCGDHWHGDHPTALRNPTQQQFQQWRRHMDGAAKALHGWGIDVVNLSGLSTLRAYPHVDPSSLFAHPESTAISS